MSLRRKMRLKLNVEALETRQLLSSLGGSLFLDADGDFRFDAGEEAAGITVFITRRCDTEEGKIIDGCEPEENHILTDNRGEFFLGGLEPGFWTVIAEHNLRRFAEKVFLEANEDIQFLRFNLSLGVSGNGVRPLPDSFEPNNTPVFATSLSFGPAREFGRSLLDEYEASVHGIVDVDWYRVSLDSYPGDGSYLELEFDQSRLPAPQFVDLDLDLYNENLQPIRRSIGLNDRERIDVSFLAPGTYFAKVYNIKDTRARYRISSLMQWRGLPADSSEEIPADPNKTVVRFEKPTPLFDGTVSSTVDAAFNGTISEGGPIHDTDLFAINMQGWAASGSSVSLSYEPRERPPVGPLPPECQFVPWLRYCTPEFRIDQRQGVDQGKLQIQLILGSNFGPTKAFPVTEQRIGNRVERAIDLTSLPPGQHYVKVAAESYDINYYSLRYKIAQTTTPPMDSHEPNDTPAQVTPISASVIEGTTHSANDIDWYSFNLTGWGNRQNRVDLQLDHSFGEIVAQLRDSNLQFLRQSNRVGQSSVATISLDDLPPGAYFVEVFGAAGAKNSYRLSASAVGTPIDIEEPNDSAATAAPLAFGGFGAVNRTIHNRPDQDWYSFDLTESGSLGNHLALEMRRLQSDNEFQIGGLQMEVYDGALNPLTPAGGGADAFDRVFSLFGYPAGRYFARVSGGGALVGEYSLHYDLIGNERLPFVVHADGFEVTQITNDDEDDVGPHTGGGAIVWAKGGAIWYFDTKVPGARPTKLSNDAMTSHDAYHIDDEGNVVWQSFDGQDDEIFLFDGSAVRQLTDNGRADRYPTVSSGHVAWQSFVDGDWEIMLYDGQSTRQLTTNSTDDFQPQIDDDNVVWMGDCRSLDARVSCDTGDTEILLYDGNAVRQLTDNDEDDFLNDTACVNTTANCRPVQQLDNGQVAWVRIARNPTRCQLHFYDGFRARMIFETSVQCIFDPSLSNGQIAIQAGGGKINDLVRVEDGNEVYWTPNTDSGGYEIFFFDGATVRQLTEVGLELVEYPVVDNGTVRWFAETSTIPYEVFLFDGDVTRQLTDNDEKELGAHLRHGQIVWSDFHSNNRGSGEIKLLDIAPRALKLELNSSLIPEDAGPMATTATVSRLNTDTSTELVVTLRSNDTTEIVVPQTVVIPPAAMSVTFDIEVVDDDLLDFDQIVIITATADYHRFDSIRVIVTDQENLAIEPGEGVTGFAEGGGGIAAVVTRGTQDINDPLEVSLQSSDETIAQVPPRLTIPAGERAVVFAINALNNNRLDGTRLLTITATANGFVQGITQLQAFDAETLTVSLDTDEVAEDDGVNAALVTVTRSNSNVEQALEVDVAVSDATLLRVPSRIVIPAGQQSVEFALAVLDDVDRDGMKRVGVFASAPGYQSVDAIVSIVDDETDLAPPILSNVPADQTIEAEGRFGATATYTHPTANDAVDSTPTVVCSPASGSIFALGTTVVTCTATDDSHNSIAASFLVTVRDTTAPFADVADVFTDPRNTSVSTITIVFSEAVTGFDLGDLRLTRGDGANLLTGAQSLTTNDNINWTLSDLSGLTNLAGSYALTLTASGSGITDDAGNALAQDASDTWTVNREADLSVIKTDSPDPVLAGNDLTYTIVVNNLGPSDNDGFTLADVIPNGTNFVSATTPDCVHVAGTVTCMSPGLLNGGSVTWVITVHVTSTTAVGTVLVSTATIATNTTTDPFIANNSDNETSTVRLNNPGVPVNQVVPERARKGKKVRTLLVTFSEDVQGADNPDNYTLREQGRDRVLGTTDDRDIRIFFVSYDTTTRSARLFLFTSIATKKLRNHQLSIFGTIRDLANQPFASDSNRTPGGDYVRTLAPGVTSSNIDELLGAGRLSRWLALDAMDQVIG